MDASNQSQLLLCALRHFGISVQQDNEKVVFLSDEVKILIEPDGTFLLRRKDKNLGRFSDVVRLCTIVQEKAMINS